MHPLRRQRLWVVLSIVLFSSAAVGLTLYALRGNIDLFYPPAAVAAGAAPLDTSIRVGGMVVDGSVRRAAGARARAKAAPIPAEAPVIKTCSKPGSVAIQAAGSEQFMAEFWRRYRGRPVGRPRVYRQVFSSRWPRRRIAAGQIIQNGLFGLFVKGP